MIMNILLVSIVGGILCLDRIFVQAMISRPIVAAPVIGLCLGDPYTGLIAGAFIELFWIDCLPIGTYIPPNDTIAAILIAAGAIESGNILGHLPPGLIAMAVLIFIPVALIAQKIEIWMIRSNEQLAKGALQDALTDDIHTIERNHFLAVIKGWILPAGLILITLPIGIFVLTWGYPRLMPWAVRGLQYSYNLLPLIGTAVALNTIHLRGMVPIFCAVFLTMTIWLYYIRHV